MIKKFKVGDLVDWKTSNNNYVCGRITKIYETTFGSKIKDTALQLQLFVTRNGRNVTTVRAKNCVFLSR